MPVDAYRDVACWATSQPKRLAPLANLTTKIYCVTKETGVYAANTTDSWLGDALDVVTKDLSVTLGASFS